MSDRSKIREWWERPDTISLIDGNLRILEEGFVLSHLGGNEDFADFGCGDGASTVAYARKVQSCIALEESELLRSRAASRFADAGIKNVMLAKGDVLDLSDYVESFNAVLTQRVLINFMSWEEQKRVLRQVHSTLRPGGLYLAIENTFEGFEAMNASRRQVGLPNVKLHDWHNYFLHRERFLGFVRDDGLFVLEGERTFDLYYLLTRVFENMFASFEGFGAAVRKDPIFEAADAAARRLQELLGDRIRFDVPSFGPIQGFALRRAS